MKITATFEDGQLSLLLLPETESEQRMVGAVIDQPQDDHNMNIDKDLVSARLQYEGHFTNQRVKSLKLSVYRPSKTDQP